MAIQPQQPLPQPQQQQQQKSPSPAKQQPQQQPQQPKQRRRRRRRGFLWLVCITGCIGIVTLVQLYSWTQLPSLHVTTLDDKLVQVVVVVVEPPRTTTTVTKTNARPPPTDMTSTSRNNNNTTATAAAAAAAATTTMNQHQQHQQQQRATTSSFTVSTNTNNNNNTNNYNINKEYDATIIIQLRGEMGNNLQKIAYGYGVAWWLDDIFAQQEPTYTTTTTTTTTTSTSHHHHHHSSSSMSSSSSSLLTPHHGNLILRHLKKSKWMVARQDIYQCFPNLRHHDFEQGNRHANAKLIAHRRHQQDEWFAGINFPNQFPQFLHDSQQRGLLHQHQQQQQQHSPLAAAARELKELQEAAYNNTWTDYIQHGELLSEWNWAMQAFYRLASTRYHPPLPLLVVVVAPPLVMSDQKSTTTTNNNHNNNNHNDSVQIAIPSIVIGSPMKNVVMDRYYDRYRTLFEFDQDQCCAQRAAPDESVFHFRQFASELSETEQTARGFEELSPYQTAHDLFGHLQVGDKIAMTTRWHNPLSQAYVDAMTARGLVVRVVTNQTGVQDFCFLLSAQKELVGVAKSTYVRWAAYLGNATRARLYAVVHNNNNNNNNKDGDTNKDADTNSSSTTNQTFSWSTDVMDHMARRQWNYSWTHPDLRSRLRLELYETKSVWRWTGEQAIP